ncbi:MAG: sulfatase [Gammaproteobacteria bacterium]|nr:sulfatase [Gammaproteobacteria bacterium]
MRSTQYLLIVVFAFLLLVSYDQVNQSQLENSPEDSNPPNFVIIFTDDLGYADINLFNVADLQTPNLDIMASEGAMFTDFYVAQPVCSASRAALMTGSYSNRVGVQGAFFPDTGLGLALSEITMAEMLKTQGYTTGHFGKWHLGDAPQFMPTNQGFDAFFGIPYSNDMWPGHPLQERFNFSALKLYENETAIEELDDQSDLTQLLTVRSVEFIKENKANPFFLYLAHPQPHTPLFASEAFRGITGKGLFADVIAELDWSVGEILNTLKEEGLDDNTLVIFTSDNGPWLSFGNHAGSAEPFREGKNTTFEGGVREPFIIRWPGEIPAGYVSDTPLMSIDLFPTLARLAGADLPVQKIDGLDVWSILNGQSQNNPHEAYFFYFADNELQGVRYQQWKLVYPHSYQGVNPQTAGQDGVMGTYQPLVLENIALYNLESDPGETTNVSADHPDVIATIELLAEEMRADLGDSLRGMEGPGRRPIGVVGQD